MHVKQSSSLDAALSTHIEGDQDPIYGGLALAQRGRMTRSQRRRAQRESERNRVTVDMPPELDVLTQGIADKLSVPRSQVVNYLVLIALQQIVQENVLSPTRWPRKVSRSMRYEFVLERYPEVPALDDILNGGKLKR